MSYQIVATVKAMCNVLFHANKNMTLVEYTRDQVDYQFNLQVYAHIFNDAKL